MTPYEAARLRRGDIVVTVAGRICQVVAVDACGIWITVAMPHPRTTLRAWRVPSGDVAWLRHERFGTPWVLWLMAQLWWRWHHGPGFRALRRAGRIIARQERKAARHAAR